MRTLLFLAFMAGFATLGYVFAPRLIEDNYRNGEESGQAAPSARDGGVAFASPTAMTESVKEITRQAPEAPKAMKQPAPQPKSKAKKLQKTSAAAESGDALDRVDAKDVERVTGLRPLHGEVKTAAYAEDVKSVVKLKQEPLKSRWIDDLSGAKVRFNKKRTNDACAEAYSNCERPEAPKDISVAGVVVKTKRLMDQPKQPLDGKIEQGNYVDKTPAVYVE